MKAALLEAAPLEALAGAAGAQIIAAELLLQLFVAMDYAIPAFHAGLAVQNPSGVCSSAQKLKSWLRRI
jgi:hypothetical protein